MYREPRISIHSTKFYSPSLPSIPPKITCPSTCKSPDACIVTHAHFSILQASRNVERATSFSCSCSFNLLLDDLGRPNQTAFSSWFLLERFQNRSFSTDHPPQSCQQHKPSFSASASGCALSHPSQIARHISSPRMDVAVLRGRIVATLDPDTDVRRRAELDLKAVSIPHLNISGPRADHIRAGRGTPRIHRCAS